jgi:hypothetical protein
VIRSPASVDQGLVADRGPDPQPRLVQAALERGLADADDLCGLLGRKAFDVSQHDGRPVIRRQFGQALLSAWCSCVCSSLRDGSSWASAGTRSASASMETLIGLRELFSSERFASLIAIR